MTHDGPGTRAPRDLVVGGVVSLVVAVLLLGPALLWPGTVLRGDMVFVPHQPWKDAWLGLDGSVPRAVPMDALVSLATYVVPGGLLQKVVLLASFVVGGTGIGAARRRGWSARRPWGVAAATTFFLWNPWVVERLSIGQWATVAGYALLPWVVLAARRLRDDPTPLGRRPGPARAQRDLQPLERADGGRWSLPWSCSRHPSRAVPRRARRVRRRRQPPVGAARRSRWATASTSPQGTGFESFRAVGESSLGLRAERALARRHLEGQRGPGRAGRRPRRRRSPWRCRPSPSPVWCGPGRTRPDARDAAGTGCGLAVALCVVPAYLAATFSSAAEVVPGLSMLRDSHRFLAPLALPVAVGLAGAVSELHRRAARGREGPAGRGRDAGRRAAPAAAERGVGLTGDLRPVSFPEEWQDVADDAARRRTSGLGGRAPVGGELPPVRVERRPRAPSTPPPACSPGTCSIDDRIVLDDEVLPGEDPRARCGDRGPRARRDPRRPCPGSACGGCWSRSRSRRRTTSRPASSSLDTPGLQARRPGRRPAVAGPADARPGGAAGVVLARGRGGPPRLAGVAVVYGRRQQVCSRSNVTAE